MVGGYGFFHSTVFKNDGQDDQKEWHLTFSPDVQYFVIDKLAVGLILGVSYDKYVNSSFPASIFGISYGPVVRYYFLPTDKKINVFSEASAAFKNSFSENNVGKNKYNSYDITGSAGISYFIGKNVALEGGLIYQYSKTTGIIMRSNIFTARIGFQIHLTGKSGEK